MVAAKCNLQVVSDQSAMQAKCSGIQDRITLLPVKC